MASKSSNAASNRRFVIDRFILSVTKKIGARHTATLPKQLEQSQLKYECADLILQISIGDCNNDTKLTRLRKYDILADARHS